MLTDKSPEIMPTPISVALYKLRTAVKERHAEKLYPDEAQATLRALELNAKLVAALEYYASGCTDHGR